MQVTETSSEGLKRELEVVIAASELSDMMATRLDEMKTQARIKGFRPGKVPVAHLRKVYGRSVMAEVVQKAVSETSQKAISERNERPAFQPSIELTEDESEVEQVMSGKADLAYKLSFEILPDIEVQDLSGLALEKPVAKVPVEEIDKSIENLRENAATYSTDEGRVAITGDQVTVDFVGKLDGEAFEGGSAEDFNVVIGKGGFIPGFEDGLLGAKAGDQRDVNATFPDGYQAEHLAGKTVVFECAIKAVAEPVLPDVDDSFAETLGMESLEKLREAVEAQFAQEHEQASRAKLKQDLLDRLNDMHSFELPPTLVENEFNSIWTQVTDSLEENEKTFEDEGKTEESAREEYQALSERRVRLGLVLSEIGTKNDVRVSEEEVRRAVVEQARRFPGQEKTFYEYIQKNPDALLQIRAPLFEDKVVDFVLELAKITENTVEPDELFRLASDQEEGDEPSDNSDG